MINITSDVQKVGVLLLSNILADDNTNSSNTNNTSLVAGSLIDDTSDMQNFLLMGVPFLIIWCLGIVILFYVTDEDGLQKGNRKVESDPEFRVFRILGTIASYFIEGIQLAAVAFGPASTKSLKGGDTFLSVLGIWIFHGHLFRAAFPAIVIIQLLMVLLLLIPTILWRKLERIYYKPIHAAYVHKSPLCYVLAFFSVCNLAYLTIPFALVLLSPIPCDFFHSGEASMSADTGVKCRSTEHIIWSVVGGVVLIVSYLMGVVSGAIPILVERRTDLALNGRFVSLRFAIKVGLAAVYVLFAARHAFIHLALTLVLQWALVLSSVSLSPSLVERLNFHRSAAYILPTIVTVCLIVSVALDDEETPFVPIACLVALLVTGTLIIIKYYCIPSRHRFPPIRIVEENIGDVRRYVAWHELQSVREAQQAERKRTAQLAIPTAPDKSSIKEAPLNDAQEGQVATSDTPSIPKCESSTHESASGTDAIAGGSSDHDNAHVFSKKITVDSTDSMPTQSSYEGAWVLGLHLPHGVGSTQSFDSDNIFTGRFRFGCKHGYGVQTQFRTITQDDQSIDAQQGRRLSIVMSQIHRQKYDANRIVSFFYQGEYEKGKRGGLGSSNIVDHSEASLYEGTWKDDHHHGKGYMTFPDGDLLEGYFCRGLPHGRGRWTYTPGHSVSHYTIEGEFEQGKLRNVALPEVYDYTGEKRFGMPHGQGEMKIPGVDVTLAGEWRAGKLHGFGRMQRGPKESGTTYTGSFVEGKFHGIGKWKHQEEKYHGMWEHGRKHGNGTQEITDGTYEGLFAEGQRQGYGTFRYKDGTVYQGSWHENLYHGAGLLKSPDGVEYEGNWIRGKRHGTRGIMTFADGTSYVGGWYEDDFHDQGTLIINDLGTYTGTFEVGTRHGLGRFVFEDGSEHVGAWTGGLANGEGHITFLSRKALVLMTQMDVFETADLPTELHPDCTFLSFGGDYSGNFQDGYFSGSGKLTAGDGTSYTGAWQRGLPDGVGVMEYPEGGVYEGSFVNGMRHGKGTMTYPDERVYRGDWAQGRRHGHGIMFGSNKEVLHDCEWFQGMIQSSDNEVTEPAAADRCFMAIMSSSSTQPPVVDVLSLLRVLLPPQSEGALKVDEKLSRQTVFHNEMEARIRLCIVAEEEVLRRRLESFGMVDIEKQRRREIEEVEGLSHLELRKTHLANLINAWKLEFSYRYNGLIPEEKDFKTDKRIAHVYQEHADLMKSS